MQTLDRILSRFEEWATTILISVAVTVTFLEVIQRYVFGGSLGWANEVTIYAVIWATLIGASLGVREGIHIGVDVVVEHMPPRIARVVTFVVLLLCAVWVLMVGIWGIDFVTFQMKTNRLTPEMEIPAWTMYISVPISMFMMAFRFVQAAVTYWRTPPTRRDAHSPATALAPEEAPI